MRGRASAHQTVIPRRMNVRVCASLVALLTPLLGGYACVNDLDERWEQHEGAVVGDGAGDAGAPVGYGNGDDCSVDDTCPAAPGCGSGTYVVRSNEALEAACEPCPSGTFADEEDAEQCAPWTECEPGQYVSREGSAARDQRCAECPEGETSTGRNAAACLPLESCPGGTVELPAADDEGPSCAPCEPGTFCAGGSAPVQPCVDDTWDHDSDPRTPCLALTICSPGEYIDVAGTSTSDRECAACPEDQYSSSENSPRCTQDGECPAGTQQTAPATDQHPPDCEACAPGEYCPGAGTPGQACSSGTWDHDADPSTPCADHTECLPGTYVAVAGDALTDVTCEACAPGTFSTAADSLECQAFLVCQPGTYVSEHGSSTSDAVCSGCPSGTHSAVSNATACDPWQDCQPGEYVLTPGSATTDRECIECPDGKYSDGLNAGACVGAGQCAPGTVEVEPATGTTPSVCEVCPAGTYCAGEQAEVVACGGETWDDDASPATPCILKTDCAAGKYVVSDGSALANRSCAACASGSYSSSTNAPSCSSWSTCSAGTYVSTVGTSASDRECTPCSAGTYSGSSNASSCTTWSVCVAPSYYMSRAGSATADRECDVCTPPEQTSTNNDPTCSVSAFQMSNGQAVMEAENYHGKATNGSWHSWRSTQVSGNSGGAAMEVGPDQAYTWTGEPEKYAPRLDFRVNFQQSGTYYVWVRGAAGVWGGAANSCYAGIDNVPIATHFDFLHDPGQWAWVGHSVQVSSGGIHTVNVWAREVGFRADKIVVSTSATAPSGTGPSESPEG